MKKLAFDTRTILIALAVLNVIGIGLSEVQRRALVEDTLRAQARYEERANRPAQQQAEALDRMVKQLTELTARVNHAEILTLAVPDASSKINDMWPRVIEMQRSLQEVKSRPTQ
ncbi:hypothetical protein [Bradyrhizobium cenepequi]